MIAEDPIGISLRYGSSRNKMITLYEIVLNFFVLGFSVLLFGVGVFFTMLTVFAIIDGLENRKEQTSL